MTPGYKTHRKYPNNALIKRAAAVCRLCPAADGDVCYKNRNGGCCPVDGGLDWAEDDAREPEKGVIPPTQTRLDDATGS